MSIWAGGFVVVAVAILFIQSFFFASHCCTNDQLDPFYLTEHRHPISRSLHVLGSTLVLQQFLASGSIAAWHAPNMLIGLATGSLLCELLASWPTGMVEFAVLLGLMIGLAWLRACPRPWLPLQMAVWGYALAWVGHFVVEQNRPATFIYPTYSLLCDYIMWYQTLTGKIPWNEYLE